METNFEEKQNPENLFTRAEYVKLYAAIFKDLSDKGQKIDFEDENFRQIKAEMRPEEQKDLEKILQEAQKLAGIWEEQEEARYQRAVNRPGHLRR